MKITYIEHYIELCFGVVFAAYIIVTFRITVTVRVSVRLWCHLVNKVSVRCV